MKLYPLSHKEVITGIATVAAVGVGLVRRGCYAEDQQRLSTLTASVLAGHRVGATFGTILFGPAGHYIGMAAGGVAGYVLLQQKNRGREKSQPLKTKKAA